MFWPRNYIIQPIYLHKKESKIDIETQFGYFLDPLCDGSAF